MKLSIGPRLADEYGKYADIVEEAPPSDMVFRCMQYVGFKIVLFAIHIVNHHHPSQHQYHPQQSSSSFLSFSSLAPFSSPSRIHIVCCLCCGLWSRVQCCEIFRASKPGFSVYFFSLHCAAVAPTTLTHSTYEHICCSCVLIL